MIRFLVLLALLIAPAEAQQVSAFPQANTPLSGAELLYLVQNGQPRQTTAGAVGQAGGIGFFLPLTGGNVTGQLLVGTGTVSPNPYLFQVAVNADPSTGSTDARESMFNTTLTNSGSTTHIWENLNSFVTVNGPGTSTGEINAIHAYMQFNSTATIAGAETYEASMFNQGNISGSYVGYLGVFTNDTAGTAGTIYGAKYGLTNNNTTSASIGTWAAIDIEAMSGAGTKPTNYYAIRNADPNGTISTVGQVVIGSLGSAGYTNTNLSISGADNSGASYTVFFKNLATANTFFVANNGQVGLGLGQVVIQPSSLGSVIGVQGTDNASGTYTFASKNLATTIIFGVNNAGVAFGGSIVSGGNTGVTCAPGSPSSSFATNNGITIHC